MLMLVAAMARMRPFAPRHQIPVDRFPSILVLTNKPSSLQWRWEEQESSLVAFGKPSARSALSGLVPAPSRLAWRSFSDPSLWLALVRGHRLLPRRIIQRPREMTGRNLPRANRFNEGWWKP
ncbi:MAG TPA: hypothetical protein VH934_12490 [Xanthobacteraceae bacterium]